ncbi:MAG: SET domain-containing protein [Candidatus Campbellbacteria bacterium]|nr:SET domain-containing protein [Candidatus Campbellbacteria bacterium]
MKKQKGYSWMNKGLKVKNTKKYGGGVFATRNIAKNEILAIFGGFIMTLKAELELPSSIRDLAHQIHDQFVIGIKTPSDKQLVDNFNHSCSPNAGFKGQIFLVAMRKIRKHEEVTFDYAMVLSNPVNSPPYKLSCLCGSKICRKVISGDDWKNLNLQKKYDGYFQYYLQEKIKNPKKKLYILPKDFYDTK